MTAGAALKSKVVTTTVRAARHASRRRAPWRRECRGATMRRGKASRRCVAVRRRDVAVRRCGVRGTGPRTRHAPNVRRVHASRGIVARRTRRAVALASGRGDKWCSAFAAASRRRVAAAASVRNESRRGDNKTWQVGVMTRGAHPPFKPTSPRVTQTCPEALGELAHRTARSSFGT